MTFEVNVLTVHGGQSLPLRQNWASSIHWVVVRGRALVTRGPHLLELPVNESLFIPAGMLHRIENPEPTPLEIVEVRVAKPDAQAL